MPACALGLQKHLFQYSLKMPACMIIFKILFGQKHCTLYLYSNGHIWIPIYEFEICVSVKNMPTEHQHLVMVLAYRKDCRRLFKYQVSCPGLAMERISVLRNFL